MRNSFDASEFLTGYLGEVEEHLSTSTTSLLAAEASLRKGETNPKAVRELFRALHTIKGLSAMVGIEPIVDVAHAMETVLRAADQAAGALTLPAIEVLLSGLRAISERVRAVAQRAPVPPAPEELLDALSSLEPALESRPVQADVDLPPEIIAKLSAAERAQLLQGTETGRRALRVDFRPSPSRASEGVTITTVRERVGAVAEIVKVVPVTVPPSEASPGGLSFALLVLADAPLEEIAAAAYAALEDVQELSVGRSEKAGAPKAEPFIEEAVESTAHKRSIVRVDVGRLDDALERLSALVISRFRLERATAELSERGVNVSGLAAIVEDYGRQVRDMRSAIMRARMVSVAELLERVPLIVRGLSRSTGKPVRVQIDAGKAELDKAVAERIFPAIVHLIRNAVDHAIEPPEERRRAGKPEEGVVKVICHERSNTQLELCIEDDGRGIDREAVAQRAGRPVPETDAGLLELITLPGLSTLDEVTKTSGRGFGMDIVKRIAVTELGGELSVRTTRGQGTSFAMRVPLTLTIVDAFAFLCGEQAFVAPVAAIDEIVDVEAHRMVRGPLRTTRFGEVTFLDRRDEVIPLMSLASVFSLSVGAGTKALVVRRNGAPFAFSVNRILGQEEVVVRPLDDPLVKVVGISGATDLGDGRPTLVLDLVGLSGALSRNPSEVSP
ncbi:MAG: chemotaxis protein CheW [Polyangiaceae bacterium]|nr:chemotaxis protein CheW [Polyangiaceae bacterium]